ncbi:MAG: penicillin-binding protein 2 [Propionibacteriaceae bacterium]|jgi:cell division protein FtsI (penicillin-binding protein 3)|nr:penicillin-binding protein 2 [Propionibacteriaceae bacterium]
MGLLKKAKRPRSRQVRPGRPKARVYFLLGALAIILSVEGVQALNLQAIDAQRVLDEHYARENSTEVRRTTLTALRGSITDRNGELLAYDEETFTITADPGMIATNGVENDDHTPNAKKMTENDKLAAATLPARLAELLSFYIGGDPQTYIDKITDPARAASRYVVLARSVPKADYRRFYDEYRRVNSELAKAVTEKGKGNPDYQDINPKEKLLGINVEKTTLRRYPGATLAANVLGYISYDEEAKQYNGAGLEYTLRDELAGTDGYEEYEGWDSKRIPLGQSTSVQPVNGQDYTLTIDAGLQSEVEQILADRVVETRGDSGVALVLDVNSGEVLAMANYPTFDPNNWTNMQPEDKEKRAQVSELALSNRAVSSAYTPGSVQKTLTFAAMLDSGTITPKTVIDVPPSVKSAKGFKPITDAWSHGTVTMYAQGILAKSSNVGTILLARRMDKNVLRDYYVSFGLGQQTGIELPGESAGILPGKDMEDYQRDGIAFGGSALIVSPVQEAAAVASVVNGGLYYKPTILKSTTLADGSVIEFEREAPKRVISAEASAQVAGLMEGMAQNSTSHTFDVPGYRVGAKTGTSKKYDFDCRCYNGLVTSTIGIGPVENPQYLVYVVVDNPRAGRSGQGVAGPAEQDIMQLVLNRYGVPPSTGKVPSYPVAPKTGKK